MAFLPTYDDLEEVRQVEQTGARLTPMAAGPAAAAGAPQAPAGAAASPGSAPGAGPYVNFARYIDANRSVADATAQSVAGSVGQAADSAQKGLQGAQAGFQQGVQAGSPFAAPRPVPARGAVAPVNPMARFQGQGTPSIAPTPGGGMTGAGVRQQGLQGTAQKGVGVGQISADEARRRAAQTYTGPTGLSVSDQLRAQTRTAQGQLAQTGTDAGRQALLRDQHGRGGGYTSGANRLDGALVGSVGGSKFRDLRSKYGDLVGALEGGERTAAAQAAAAAASTGATAANYASQVGQFDTEEAERKRLLAEMKAAPDVREKAQQDLQTSQRTKSRQERRGVSDQTTTATDSTLAARDGLYTEWIAAGRPPYDAWKASRG